MEDVQQQRCHRLQQLLKCRHNLCMADRRKRVKDCRRGMSGEEKWSKVGKAIYSSTGLNIFHNFMIITMASTIITMIIIFMCAVAKWGNFKFL